MTQAPEEPTDPPAGTDRARRIRWWPAAIILLLAAGRVVWIWETYRQQRQDRNLAIILTVVLTLLLLLLWCLFLSRLRWKVRLGAFGCVLGLICLGIALFRFHGVTGDLLPVFRWRWERPSWTSLQEQPKAISTLLPRRSSEFTNDWPQFLGPHRNSVV
jgi:outer membrane protein assembly factor BamB